MPGLAPVAMHQGGANIGALGEREVQMTRLFEAQTRDAIATEVPLRLDDPKFPGKPARVFRIPRVHGFAHHFAMKREQRSLTGDVIAPAERKTVQFEQAGSGGYGELVTADPEIIREVEEVLMKHPDHKHRGIVDYFEERVRHQEQLADEDAKKFADPSYLRRVVEKIKAMGVEASDSFADILTSPQR